MCGRYYISTEEENLEIKEILDVIRDRYKDKNRVSTGEIYPTNTAPVLITNENNELYADAYRWGFPPFKLSGPPLINARSETLHEKPLFRNLLSSKKCIVPASGFFEWKKEEKTKTKYYIRSENPVIYMAGLYNTYKFSENEKMNSFVIITTASSGMIAEIHTRKPVIFDLTTAKKWLTSGFSDIDSPNFRQLSLTASIAQAI